MHIDRQGAAGVKIKGVGYLLEITGTYVVQVGGVFFFFSSCGTIIMTSMLGILKTSLIIPKTRLVFREKIYSLSSFANIFYTTAVL